MLRQIVLDTETTGLEPEQGHRIIEIGCVELIDRQLTGNNYHQYLQPDRDIDEGAVEVHGITNEFLTDKPRFTDIVDDFLHYIDSAQLIIHNAPFDVGFMDHEIRLVSEQLPTIADRCMVIDTLTMARRKHVGQRNSLDALCKRYDIDNSHRELHGALLDAEILADVYLMMTGGQVSLQLDQEEGGGQEGSQEMGIQRLANNRPKLKVMRASADEMAEHEARLSDLGAGCVWLKPV